MGGEDLKKTNSSLSVQTDGFDPSYTSKGTPKLRTWLLEGRTGRAERYANAEVGLESGLARAFVQLQ